MNTKTPSTKRTRRTRPLIGLTALTGLSAACIVAAAPAFADDVTLAPTGAGAPGSTGIGSLLNWIGQYSLWILLGSFVLGAGIIGGGQLVGHQGAGRGRSAMLGAGLGAMGVGIAAFAINTLYGTFAK